MKLVDWSEKLPPLQREAEELRLTLKSIIDLRRVNRRLYLTDQYNFVCTELKRVNNQIYHLVTFKPIFIEEELP